MGCGGSKPVPLKPVPVEATDEVYLRREQYDAVVSYEKKKIATLFKLFDTDKSGALDKEELMKIITRYNGSGDANMDQFMGFYDTHVKDELIDPKEFGWYLASIAKVLANDDDEKLKGAIATVVDRFALVLVAAREEERYECIVAKVRPQALALFKHIDKDDSGALSKTELRHIVERFSLEMDSEGQGFPAQGADGSKDPNFLKDEDAFFKWFDVHSADGKGADGVLDFADFRWFLAQSAMSVKGDPLDNISRVIATFEKICGAPHSAPVVHHQTRMKMA